MLRGWLRLLLDVVFPATCEGCDTTLPAGHPSCLCDACKAALGRAEGSLCERCGVPVASDSPCAACRTRPPAFGRARAAGWYVSGSVLASAVQSLKYRRRRHVADVLGAHLAAHYPFPTDVVLVPVPLHPARLRARGFNQALLLARALGRRCGLPVAGPPPGDSRPARPRCGRAPAKPPTRVPRAYAGGGGGPAGRPRRRRVDDRGDGRRLRPGAARSGGPSGRCLYRGAGTVTAGWWALRGRTRSAKGTAWSRPAF